MIALVWPNTMLEIRRVACDCYVVGSERVYDLELVADAVHADARIACSQANCAAVPIRRSARVAKSPVS